MVRTFLNENRERCSISQENEPRKGEQYGGNLFEIEQRALHVPYKKTNPEEVNYMVATFLKGNREIFRSKPRKRSQKRLPI
ncbi:hypothetical protein D0T08_19070 [Emticicia sp. C21]|nr:hypothetical protein D0T08_19070 [Emticicia sp. C21]